MTTISRPELGPAELTSAELTLSDTELRNASLPARTSQPGPDIRPAGTGRPLSPDALAGIARALAGQVDVWQPLLQVNPDRRWYRRLQTGDSWEAWLLTWLPGQGTDLHDHGGSSGAFAVLSGQLEELTPGTGAARLEPKVFGAGQVRAFGPRYVHQVTGVSSEAAASLHVYGPALTVMNRYELHPDRGLVLALTERAGQDW